MSFTNFNIGNNAENYETSEIFDTYGRVDVVLGEDEEGNILTVSYPDIPDDQVGGRILTVQIPMCTDTTLARTAAQRIYNSLTTGNDTGFQYQPMQADGTLADPSMEFGDSVDINGVHSGFYTRDVTFGRLMRTDLSSPTDEELDHEYPYQDAQQRQITRTNKELKAGLYVTNNAITAEVEARTAQGEQFASQLQLQATQIAAKVSQTGGNNSSFGWTLTSTGHTWYSGNRQVMKVNSSGLEVTGKITATSGQIGGFTIGSSSIYSNGMSSMSSGQSTGVHVGTDGLKLGQNFKVDTSGNVTANNMTLTGTLNIGGSSISASQLRQGASDGYSWSNGSYGSTGQTRAAYALSGAGGGINFSNMEQNLYTAKNVRTQTLHTGTMTCTGQFFQRGSFFLDSGGSSYQASWKSANVITSVSRTRMWSSQLGMYVVTDVSHQTGTIYYVGR